LFSSTTKGESSMASESDAARAGVRDAAAVTWAERSTAGAIERLNRAKKRRRMRIGLRWVMGLGG